MKTYQKPDGALWAFEEDGSQDDLIAAAVKNGWVFKTEEQIDTLMKPTVAQLWAARQSQAKAILNENDITAIRCWKANVLYPSEWLLYDIALRLIVHAPASDPTPSLPTPPVAWPIGT